METEPGKETPRSYYTLERNPFDTFTFRLYQMSAFIPH